MRIGDFRLRIPSTHLRFCPSTASPTGEKRRRSRPPPERLRSFTRTEAELRFIAEKSGGTTKHHGPAGVLSVQDDPPWFPKPDATEATARRDRPAASVSVARRARSTIRTATVLRPDKISYTMFFWKMQASIYLKYPIFSGPPKWAVLPIWRIQRQIEEPCSRFCRGPGRVLGAVLLG